MSSRKKEYDMLRAFGLALMVSQHQGLWGGTAFLSCILYYVISYAVIFHNKWDAA